MGAAVAQLCGRKKTLYELNSVAMQAIPGRTQEISYGAVQVVALSMLASVGGAVEHRLNGKVVSLGVAGL